nr:TrbI/VirB10 family protein ['Sphingomonas ginsengisoli' Hoang et al. 2012]
MPYAPPPPLSAPLPRVSSGSIIVADASTGREVTPESNSAHSSANDSQNGNDAAWAGAPRVRAGTLSNKSGTVAQGSMISAVLETALDSNQKGFARALVSRDVKSFDGSRVLVPRGSRLIGEYQSQLSPGERRAGIIWSRIIRPDGVTMELDSPAVDPLGRSGVPASVNTHFFSRLGTALLRTTLDIGTGLATRSSRSPVIVALPGSLQGTTAATVASPERPPTLRVRAGKSISVFVARDLDFGSDERRQ